MIMKKIFLNWQWWILSVSIPVTLTAIRMCLTHTTDYGFYFWNLFLAFIPLLASTCLSENSSILSLRNSICLACWFFFLPNAPYLITDIMHYEARPPVPVYLDQVIVYSAAWNGLLMAYVSIMRVERWLLLRYKNCPVNMMVIALFLLCGLGIFLGRYQRWNSWDVVVQPIALAKDILIRIVRPQQYKTTWAVTILFGALLSSGYFLLKKLPSLVAKETSKAT